MINFIFFGRLEYSKGIDLIINFILNYPDFCKEKSFNFYIFWDWSYAKQVKSLEHKFNFVQYFWWQSKDVIRKYLKKSDFTLMPSRFIETFWLSALESLAEWVPVIWFKKGGLKQFVFDELDLRNNHRQFDVQLQTMETKQSQAILESITNNEGKTIIDNGNETITDNKKNTTNNNLSQTFSESSFSDFLSINNYRQWDKILSSDYLLKKSFEKSLFNLWFLQNDLWDKWNDKLKQYYRKKCLDIAANYTVDRWIQNFLKITWQ